MRLTYEQLLNYDIPPVRQEYGPKDCTFYALSVGLGRDPADARELQFVDERHGPSVLPSMALVLGYPGFWTAAPEVGADTVRLLHGEQGIELFRPLPPKATVIGKTRVTDAIDKGEKGLLLYSEKTLTDARTGEVLARTFATHVLRGDGGIGGPQKKAPPPHPMPDDPPDQVLEIETRPEQALLYRLNGDFNPLHSDPAVAARAGYPRPILHGLCTFAMVAHAVARALAPDAGRRLRRIALRFSGPVLPGETIRVELWPDGSFRARVPERDSIVVDNGIAVLR